MDASTIAAQLRQKIIEGEYPHGSKLPTVRDLAAEHGALFTGFHQPFL
ncbi:GntR family transcriptional regulator [Streptomyces cinereoruber]